MTGFGFSRRDDGATAVEFAFVAPLIVAFAFGVFEVGRAMYEQNHVAAAAAEGSRILSVYGADEAAVRAAVKDKLRFAPDDKVAVTIADQQFGSQTVKKLTLTYSHKFLINLGDAFSGLDFTVTRYAAVANLGAASQTSGGTSGGTTGGDAGGDAGGDTGGTGDTGGDSGGSTGAPACTKKNCK